MAEASAREVGRLTLLEALELTALYANRDWPRFGRVAVRWLQRYLEQTPDVTLEDAALATAALGALGGRRHGDAMATLRALAAR